MLDGRKPPDLDRLRRLPIDARQKRVFAAVLARRFPDQAKDLLTLARSLDFYRDPVSLCLRKVLE